MRNVRRVACQLSGSVNSAVSAFLLKQKGLGVTGVYIHNRLVTDQKNADQLEKAQLAADQLGIPLQEINLLADQWNVLKTSLLSEYRKGNSPDACVLYHKHVTYHAAVDEIDRFTDAEAVSTGHLARTAPGNETHPLSSVSRGTRVLKAVDQQQDDSFFLGQVTQKYVRRLALPLGETPREVVRTIAELAGLQQLNHKTEIISPEMLEESIWKELPASQGEFLDLETGKVEGQHTGIHRYVIGQEIRLDSGTFYVTDKNIHSHQITVVRDVDHSSLYSHTFFTTLANWVYRTPYSFYEKMTMPCEFRTGPDAPTNRCVLTVGATNEWCGNDHVIVSSAGEPIRGLTPGHFVAFYRDEECIGGATIMRPGPSVYAMEYHKHGKDKTQTEKTTGSPLKSILDKFSWPP